LSDEPLLVSKGRNDLWNTTQEWNFVTGPDFPVNSMSVRGHEWVDAQCGGGRGKESGFGLAFYCPSRRFL